MALTIPRQLPILLAPRTAPNAVPPVSAPRASPGSDHLSPWRPLAYGTLASSGKLVSAIGASAAVRASETHAVADKAIAGVCLGSGLCAAVSAALLFGADAAHVTGSREAALLKAISISSALCLSAGSALRQLGQSKDVSAYIWGAYAISTFGYGLVSYSLPSFFALSEARRGPAIVRHRPAVAWVLMGAGFALTQGWANSTPLLSGKLPAYLSSVVLTMGATASLLGFAIVCADEQALRRRPVAPINPHSEPACA